MYYANDFSYLKDPAYQGCCLGDCLKLMPLGSCGQSTLDLGGQLRLRYHHEEGMGQDRVLGDQRFLDSEHDFLLTRLRLYANWKVSDCVRLYVEGLDARAAADDTYNYRVIDRNSMDLQNAFVDLKLLDSLTVRVGRQELLYGVQRFVSRLDWANTRRTFEGIKLLYTHCDRAVDVFFTNFVPVDPFEFDEANYDISFYGMWATYTGIQNHTLDIFYLGFDDERNLASSQFSLHTAGASLRGGGGQGWLWDLTGAGQFGDAAGVGIDQSAAMCTVGIGSKQFQCLPWKPVAWLYWDYATGNPSLNNVVGDNNAYNQLFPLVHKYLGFIDAVQRSNIESPNLLVTAAPSPKVDLLLWYYHFQSNGEDRVLSIGGTPTQNTSKYFGNELDCIVKYKICARSNILYGYSHLWRGNKIVNPQDADPRRLPVARDIADQHAGEVLA